MAERRSLVDGLKATPPVDPALEEEFILRNRPKVSSEAIATKSHPSAGTVSRVALSSRMRTDLAHALKRASLQRQLDKIEPSSLTEILEAAVEPWLRSNGYLN